MVVVAVSVLVAEAPLVALLAGEPAVVVVGLAFAAVLVVVAGVTFCTVSGAVLVPELYTDALVFPEACLAVTLLGFINALILSTKLGLCEAFP